MGDIGADRSNGTGSSQEFSYRGNRLGLPSTGSGSVPGFGRRIAGLLLDWLLCVAATQLLFDTTPAETANTALLVFALQEVVLISLLGTTVGRGMVGIRISGTGERRLPWFVAVLVRTVLLCLVIPAVVYDRDQRGLHDRAAGTVTQRI
ncbi:RDD family protein [Marinactinospora rubrisoli]|uniref:RDD family protein n=1 Tax=Marinactinospora rubrisoli TaxID=2715399 RepID=A0ABW2KN10_9ACTN